MKIKILGNGIWGQAVASLIQHNKRDISFIGREEYSGDQDILILAVPVQAMREALEFISFKTHKKIVINTAKGIERGSHKLPQEIVQDILGTNVEYFALLGPSFAHEVMAKMPTIVNLAYNGKSDDLNYLIEIFQTEYFNPIPVQGVQSLELASSFKNMYAIVCGLSEGLGYGMNTRVALLVKAMQEFRLLCQNLNFHIDQSAAIGTTGDLILTCNSIESRNYTFGKYLATMTVYESLQKIGSATEGYYSLSSVKYYENNANIKLPMLRFIDVIVKQNEPSKVKEQFLQFFKAANG